MRTVAKILYLSVCSRLDSQSSDLGGIEHHISCNATTKDRTFQSSILTTELLQPTFLLLFDHFYQDWIFAQASPFSTTFSKYNRHHETMSPIETLYTRIVEGLHKTLEIRKKRKQLRPPSVVRRERTLSISNESDTKIPYHSQIDCLIFRLPLELRLDIYKLVIGAEDVHVLLRSDRIFSYRNAKPDQLLHTHNREALKPWKRSLQNPAHPREELPGLGVLPLLQTCRRMYVRSINVLIHAPLKVDLVIPRWHQPCTSCRYLLFTTGVRFSRSMVLSFRTDST